MIVDILSLIPPVFDNVFDESILGAAKKGGLIEIRIHNFRDFGEGNHKTVDDSPFGGGPGMVLKANPLVSSLRKVRMEGMPAPVIGLTPQGIPLKQELVKQLARYPRIVLVCGRYEGFDDRILSEFDLEISVGDYVISGGEFAAMTLVDAISRMIPGTVGRQESVEQASFYDGVLDHPQYTRPAIWEGHGIPPVLQAGNHAHIDRWRRGQALVRTALRRPDLFAQASMTSDDQKAFQSVILETSTS